jgi:DNA-binding NtrC family response regulator
MRSKRLLIVDDDRATRDALAQFLERAGLACTTVATLPDALVSIQLLPPNLLITDIRLGEYNGLQLVINRPAHIPVIVITGFPDTVLESEAIRYGAVFLRKPIDPNELLALVTKSLSAEGGPDPSLTPPLTGRWCQRAAVGS